MTLFGCFGIVVFFAGLIVNFAFALAVFQNADEVVRHRGATALVGPWIWTLATLLTGVVGGALYWLVHHGSAHADLAQTQVERELDRLQGDMGFDPEVPPSAAPTGAPNLSSGDT